MKDFYANPTLQKLSLLGVRAESTNEITKVELSKDATFRSKISWKTVSVQSLAWYVFFGLPGLMLTIWFYLSENITKVNIFEYNTPIYDISDLFHVSFYYLLIALFLFLFYIPTSILIAVIAKRLLIGRYTPGQHPLWGSFYLCWWLANAVQSLVPVGVFAGSPIMIWYCRLMGARIGKDCYIGTSRISCYDLIHIGDGTSIGSGSQLLGYSVASDRIKFNTIDIGRDCYVGANCVLSINTVMGDGAMLCLNSWDASLIMDMDNSSFFKQ
jgi:non-ribosomal peptide synthetase-like protein